MSYRKRIPDDIEPLGIVQAKKGYIEGQITLAEFEERIEQYLTEGTFPPLPDEHIPPSVR